MPRQTADRICNFNRHYAEYAGYWERETSFLQDESAASGEINFYDSNTGNPLFTAPKGLKRCLLCHVLDARRGTGRRVLDARRGAASRSKHRELWNAS